MILAANSPSSRSADSAWAWPEDYVALDEGRLWVRPDLRKVFEDLSWTTAQSILKTERCVVIRRLAARDNCRVVIPHPFGKGVIKGYLKRHWTSDPFGWLLCRMTGKNWRPPGPGEADQVGRLQKAGVPTMSVLAAGVLPGKLPWRADSFFLSEEIASGVPADDFWVQRMGAPEEARSTPLERTRLLEAMAGTARAFHDGHLFHRDFYWCHFFIREPAPGEFEASLIDLQRVKQSRLMSWRWRVKDLAQFRFSIPAGLLSVEEQRHWFRHYRGVRELGAGDRFLDLVVAARTWFYRWKDGGR